MGRRAEVDTRGFTLLELLVTLMLIALALGLAGPAVGRTADSLRARADVAGFAAVLRHARDKAIADRVLHVVVVEPDEHRITVHAGGPDGEVRETRALPTRLTIEAHPPPTPIVRFEPHGTSSGGRFTLSAGPVIYVVSVDALTGRVKSARQ